MRLLVYLQSANSNSQFVYTRYKSVGYDEDLFFQPITTVVWNEDSGISGQPVHHGTILPYNPTGATTPGSSNANVWSGTYSAGSPVGSGKLNELCVHISHPAIVYEATQTSPKTFKELVKPAQPSPGSKGFVYPEFRHAAGFEAAITDVTPQYPSNQTKPYQQLGYTLIKTNVYGIGGDNHSYPEKLGFSTNDEYLIGKYSCGAYLFMAPSSHAPIQVEGSTSLATKVLSAGAQNAIVIPVLFQMRCQDKLGYIGGYRASGTIRNITYTKRIGIDIKVSNEEIFSFDLSVSGSYTKSALASPTYSSFKDTLGVKRFNN